MKCKLGDWAFVYKHKHMSGYIVHIVDKDITSHNWIIEKPILTSTGKHIQVINEEWLFPIKELEETEKKDFLNDMDVLSKILESSWQAKLDNISKLQAKVKAWKKRNRGL